MRYAAVPSRFWMTKRHSKSAMGRREHGELHVPDMSMEAPKKKLKNFPSLQKLVVVNEGSA